MITRADSYYLAYFYWKGKKKTHKIIASSCLLYHVIADGWAEPQRGKKLYQGVISFVCRRIILHCCWSTDVTEKWWSWILQDKLRRIRKARINARFRYADVKSLMIWSYKSVWYAVNSQNFGCTWLVRDVLNFPCVQLLNYRMKWSWILLG